MMKKELPLYLRFCLLCFVQLLTLPALSFCEEVVIAVSSLPERINYLWSKDPSSSFIRSLTTSPLIHRIGEGEESSLSLDLADSLEASNSGEEFLVRLRYGLRFHNGRPVNSDDIEDSLKRCAERRVSAINQDSVSGSSFLNDFQIREHWVRFKLRGASSLEEALGSCPILPTEESSSFGDRFGTGTLLVGTGAYRITDFKPGREIELSRHPQYHRGGLRVDQIRIRLIADPEQGLTALRLGTTMAYLTENEDIIAASKADETLTLSRCSFGTVLHRTKFRLHCQPQLDVANLHYVRR